MQLWLQIVSVFGIGGGIGVIVGGMIGQYLYNKRRRYMPLFTGALMDLIRLFAKVDINPRRKVGGTQHTYVPSCCKLTA